jgi:DNA recombination protein RmuC
METYLLIILIIGLVVLLGFVFLLYKKIQAGQTPKEGDQNVFIMLQNQIQDLSKMVDQKITDTHKTMNETQQTLDKTIQSQFGQSMKIITEVTQELTSLKETNKQVMGFTAQLENLQNTLQNPKHRGILGEYFLENVLKNVLPPGSYQMQYKFLDGDIVDAVVFVKEKIIPLP